METPREARKRAADLAAQEQPVTTAAGLPARPGVVAPGFVHYGELRYVPGELLPAEVAAALEAQQPERDELGVYHLDPAQPSARRKEAGRAATRQAQAGRQGDRR
jgi:hypothetical protein